MAEKTNPDNRAVEPQSNGDPRPTITRQSFDRPIVLKYKRGKKGKQGKQGYSRQLGDIQRTEAGLAKVSEKAARAVAKGAKAYNTARKKSVRSKRDGAVRDFVPNLAEGLSESMRRASSIPVDVADALNTKSSRRLLRNQLRLARNGFRLWRL